MLTTPRPASCPAIRRHKPPPPRCLRCTALGRRAAQTGNSHGQPFAALDTSTLFGAFKIDQATGAQVSHRTVLIRWADEEPIAIQTQAEATQPTTLKAG